MLYFRDLKRDFKNSLEFLGEACLGRDCTNSSSVLSAHGSGLELKLMYRNAWNSVHNTVANPNSIKISGVAFICHFHWSNANASIWLIIKLINNLAVRALWLGD